MHNFILFAILLIVNAANAQTISLPTDIDLKTAYCLKLKQWQVPKIKAFRDSKQSGSLSYMSFDKMLRDTLTDVRRLESYLFPRLQYLEKSAVLAAATRGEADTRELEVMSQRCADVCTDQNTPSSKRSCMEKCTAIFPAQSRALACAEVTWLPF